MFFMVLEEAGGGFELDFVTGLALGLQGSELG